MQRMIIPHLPTLTILKTTMIMMECQRYQMKLQKIMKKGWKTDFYHFPCQIGWKHTQFYTMICHTIVPHIKMLHITYGNLFLKILMTTLKIMETSFHIYRTRHWWLTALINEPANSRPKNWRFSFFSTQIVCNINRSKI